MASVTIKGTKYDLLFDMWALEQIETEFGGVNKMLQNLHGGEDVSMTAALRTVFRILANCARDAQGLALNVTGDEIRHCPVGQLTAAVRKAIEEGMKSETTGGNEADDSVHDEYLEEIEKNV